MSLWTTKLVRHFLYTRFGVEYCRERVRQMLHALGFRLRRLRHCHLKANPEEQSAFVTDVAILLKDWPEDWELLCVDEATVRRHPTAKPLGSESLRATEPGRRSRDEAGPRKRVNR